MKLLLLIALVTHADSTRLRTGDTVELKRYHDVFVLDTIMPRKRTSQTFWLCHNLKGEKRLWLPENNVKRLSPGKNPSKAGKGNTAVAYTSLKTH